MMLIHSCTTNYSYVWLKWNVVGINLKNKAFSPDTERHGKKEKMAERGQQVKLLAKQLVNLLTNPGGTGTPVAEGLA